MLNQKAFKICLFLLATVVAQELREFRKNSAFTAYDVDRTWSDDCQKCWDSIMDKRCACATNSSNFHKDVFVALKGAELYKLHISLQSIIPNGNTKNLDKRAINYYRAVIDDVLKQGIEPMIVITRDFPSLLRRKNEVTIDYFRDFARVLFETFENRVKYWLVVDEHCLQCSTEEITPSTDMTSWSEYRMNMILRSFTFCHFNEKEFKDVQSGQICLECCDWHADIKTNKPTKSREAITAEDVLNVLLSPNNLYDTREAVSTWSNFLDYFGLYLNNPYEHRTISHSALPLVNAPYSSGKKFSKDFILGSATSAYQIEGGWNADGKGESMWDNYLHNNVSVVEDRTNGDVAADSYHLYKRDVELLKELGAKSYRFSISWTRVLPNGTADYINPLGIAYYDNLINELLANDIMPLVTIYHWDLPIGISNQGGWLSEKTVDFYVDYARVVFAAFGDRVKHWVTVNEPHIHCYLAYGTGKQPPFIKSPGIGYYECGRYLLLAHAKAYHLYNEEFRELQGGKVGIALDMDWPIAASDSKEDIEATEDYIAFYFGHYTDPIFKGNYPRRMIERVAKVSASQGYNSSRLRPFNKEQRDCIKGTADFLGINHYSSKYVYRNESVIGMYDAPSFDNDTDLAFFADPSWPESALPGMTEYAPGLYHLLVYLKDTYDNPMVYVTESGFPLSIEDGLNDDKKVHYLRNYLNALLDAKAAGSNVQGYFFWSLVDTLEWTSGYTLRFALYQVDTDDPARPRTARKSALVYREIIRTRTVNHDYNPKPYEQNEVK